jgi:hypothetical protein
MRKQGWVLGSGAAARLMSKPGPRFVTIACCALMNACGPTTPSSPALDGQWSGTTSQGTPITFTVSSDQKMTAITVGYRFNGCSGEQTFSNLNLETAPMVTCIPGPCSNTLSSYRAFSYSAGSIDGPFTTVNGLFTVTNRAEGQVAFRDYPGCGTAVGIGWTATKR